MELLLELQVSVPDKGDVHVGYDKPAKITRIYRV